MNRLDPKSAFLLSRSDWRRAGSGLRTVLSGRGYVALAVFSAAVWVVALTTLENYRLVWDVVLWGTQSTTARLQVFLALLPLVGGPIDPLWEASALLISGLSGLLVAGLVYRLRSDGGFRSAGAGGIGVTLAAIGGGCGACGSVLLAVVGLGTATGIPLFPFGGAELLAVSIGILVVAVLHTAAAADRDSCEL